MTDSINPADINQTEYMKLFMQELTYQDPLKPIDNREFMAQMAQFSALQQTTDLNNKLQELLWANYNDRALSLLHNHLEEDVKINNSNSFGSVQEIRFNDNGKPQLRVFMQQNGEEQWVDLNQIVEVVHRKKG